MKQINHLSVALNFAQEVIYIEDGGSPFTLTIRSNDELAQELKYQCVEWLVKGKVVSASDPIEPGYEFSYGDNPLYYQPNPGSEGQHTLEITLSDEKGTLRKKQQVTITVKDHLPIDFQVGLKPEKIPVLVHEPVKLILDITSREVSAAQLNYQIKEISTDKKGTFSATAQGTPIGASHALSYGKNVLYYNNPAKELGMHDIKLVVVSSKGDTQTVLASLNILDTDFQVKLKLEKPTIFFYEPAKMLVEITSKQPEASQLSYHIQEVSSSTEKGKFYASADGGKICSEHALIYGKNVLYYQSSGELGTHDLKLIVTNSNGNTQTVLASLQVLDTDFQVKLKPEKPTIFSHEQAKLIVQITSKQEDASHKQPDASKLSYRLKEISTLEKGKFFASAEGSKISTNHALNYGKNVLYYNPCKQLGTHDLKLVVASSQGSVKTVSTSLQVLDTDFQLKLKPEKPTIFFHESAKMILEISSHQEGSDQLSYQIQELIAHKKGHFSLTPQGEPIGEEQALNYGKNVLYYHPNQALGAHELKLVISNSNGNTQTVLTSLQVLDIDFQVKLKPEKPAIFCHELAKMTLEISPHQAGSDKLTYQLQELSAHKKGHFSWTPQGEPIGEKQALCAGKHVLYYNPFKQLGTHELKLVIASSQGSIKTGTTSLEVLDTDFQVKLKPEKPTIFFHELAKMMLEISSHQEGSDQLTYRVQELIAHKKGHFSLTPQGEPIGEKQALNVGKNVLYYHPNQALGTHELKLVITNSNGNTQTVLASVQVLDINFQVKIKPEKPKIFCHDSVKLIIELTTEQEGTEQLAYQVKELSASIQGGEFLTTDGNAIVAGQALKQGKNVWYYTPHQPSNQAIQLMVVNSHGTTQEATASLDVLDTDFQLEIKPEKANMFAHEPVKVMVNITAGGEDASKLTYQLKELSTSIEIGQFSTTPQGTSLSPGQALSYGKNVWYYTPHQPGNHTIQLVVANNKGTTKEVKALLTANQAIFSAEVKLNKPAKSPDTTWEVGLHCGSNSGLKEEKWQLASWQLEECSLGKLQDAEGHELAKKDVSLQVGLNKFKLVLAEAVELKSLPQLKLAILQPDRKEKQLVVDLSGSVLCQLERALGLLAGEHQIACQKLVAKDPFAQDKLDRVIHQLKMLRSNLELIAQSTVINQDHLENSLVKTDQMLRNSSQKALIDCAIQKRFGRGVNETDQQGRTPLIEAIDKKDLEGLDLVLSHPDVNLKVRHPLDPKNNTAAYPVLSYAIMKGGKDTQILEKLLKAGADIHDRVLITRQPLAVSTDSEFSEYRFYKYDRGLYSSNLQANIKEHTITVPEWSPRHQVANQDSLGETALHVASAAKLIEPIEMLLAHGANVNAKNSYWQTPLHLAIYGGERNDAKVEEVVKYLLEQGASINAGDLNDNTPLHYYFMFKSSTELRSLLEKKGADHEARNWLYGKNKFGKQVNEQGVAPTEMKF